MKHFCIVANKEKDKNLEVTGMLRTMLENGGKRVSIRIRPGAGKEQGEEPLCMPKDADCFLVLGGDGTLLQTARDLVDTNAPLLGINLGTLGYLAEVERAGIGNAVKQLLSGEYQLEERMMLTGQAVRNGVPLEDTYALNDVVIARNGPLQIVEFDLYVNGQFLNRYSADGVIIATPTGSTGYNMSAGGPIVEPTAKLIIVTPICPHTTSARSIILSAKDVVTVKIRPAHDRKELRAEASFDGSRRVILCPEDEVAVARLAKTTTILKLKDISFLEALHKKMSGQ